ncbi:MAG: hypothetical protein QXT26_08550 [Thermoproteota archaeon]
MQIARTGMKCPECGKTLNISDEEYPLWVAYVCRQCGIIILKMRAKYG